MFACKLFFVDFFHTVPCTQKNQQKIICMSTCSHANYFLLIFSISTYCTMYAKKSTKNNLHSTSTYVKHQQKLFLHVDMQIIFCCFFPYHVRKKSTKNNLHVTCSHANDFLLFFSILYHVIKNSTKYNLHVNMFACKIFFVDFLCVGI